MAAKEEPAGCSVNCLPTSAWPAARFSKLSEPFVEGASKDEDWRHESSGAKPLLSLLATSLIEHMCMPSRYYKTD